MNKKDIILTQSQFARCLGYTPQAVKVYINRNQLQATKDGKINITEPLNDAFINKCRANGRIFNIENLNSTKKKQNQAANQNLPQSVLTNFHNKAQEKQDADIERIRTVTKVNQLKLDKAAEKYIPKEVAQYLINYEMQFMKSQLIQSLDGILELYKARFDLDHTEYVELKKQTHDSIRQAFSEAVQDMKSQVKQAAAEIAGEFEQGQKKN